MRSIFALVIACTMLLPVSGMAAQDAHAAGWNWQELGYLAFNLALLVGVLVYFGRKPIVDFFDARHAQIKGDRDAAVALLREAEERYSEIERRLADLGSQVEEMHETTRRRTEEESERILADARKTAERIAADASAAVDQELLRAKRALRAEAADLALQLAADILREHVTDADQERLVDEFITRVESNSESAR